MNVDFKLKPVQLRCYHCRGEILDLDEMVTGSPTRTGSDEDPVYCCRWCREVMEGW